MSLRNPAALGAAMRGDTVNARIASTPGGIEAQEKAGQSNFVNSQTLPIPDGETRARLEAMGVQFGDPVDDIFVNATLPAGWQKIASDHSMWSSLVDAQGKKVASIFYKAAFYDRRADITLEP